jgi:uncharacterized membrane-anchored protein YitT (DUF2179 family)
LRWVFALNAINLDDGSTNVEIVAGQSQSVATVNVANGWLNISDNSSFIVSIFDGIFKGLSVGTIIKLDISHKTGGTCNCESAHLDT